MGDASKDFPETSENGKGGAASWDELVLPMAGVVANRGGESWVQVQAQSLLGSLDLGVPLYETSAISPTTGSLPWGLHEMLCLNSTVPGLQ